MLIIIILNSMYCVSCAIHALIKRTHASHSHTRTHTYTHSHQAPRSMSESWKQSSSHKCESMCLSIKVNHMQYEHTEAQSLHTNNSETERAHTHTHARRVCVTAFPLTHTQLECSAEKCQNRKKGGRKEENIIGSKKKIKQAEWEIRRKGKGRKQC